MTASTTGYYGILGLTSDATLADVKKAYRKLARQHHPDRNHADPGAIDRFRRITEAYEYLSARLKDNAHGNGHSRPGPAAPPRTDAGVPGGFSEAASRVLTMIGRLTGLGAIKLNEINAGRHWATLADPEGNEFDVIAG
jgi:DnaJ-class molecular chaperone